MELTWLNISNYILSLTHPASHFGLKCIFKSVIGYLTKILPSYWLFLIKTRFSPIWIDGSDLIL